MTGIRGKNTGPALFAPTALHARGFRYRFRGTGLPGSLDLVFSFRKIAIFIHGYFWHRHECRYFKWPNTNSDFWVSEINKNAEQGACNVFALEALGWCVCVVWECALRETRY